MPPRSRRANDDAEETPAALPVVPEAEAEADEAAATPAPAPATAAEVGALRADLQALATAVRTLADGRQVFDGRDLNARAPNIGGVDPESKHDDGDDIKAELREGLAQLGVDLPGREDPRPRPTRPPLSRGRSAFHEDLLDVYEDDAAFYGRRRQRDAIAAEDPDARLAEAIYANVRARYTSFVEYVDRVSWKSPRDGHEARRVAVSIDGYLSSNIPVSVLLASDGMEAQLRALAGFSLRNSTGINQMVDKLDWAPPSEVLSRGCVRVLLKDIQRDTSVLKSAGVGYRSSAYASAAGGGSTSTSSAGGAATSSSQARASHYANKGDYKGAKGPRGPSK